MEATLTVKGQITLPKALRDALHLKTGDRILFEEGADGTYFLRPRTTAVHTLKGCVFYTGSPKTLQEMEQAIMAQAAGASE
jgi:AbrB family looped-hinge helix DNA binding protein